MDLDRAARRIVNPVSTAVTRLAWRLIHRLRPRPPQTAALARTGRPWPAAEDLRARQAMRSPAGHVAPAGTIPAWNWIPPGYGLHPLLGELPRWVRWWYRTPYLERFAHAWMWQRGYWEMSIDRPDPGEPQPAFVPPGPRPSRTGPRPSRTGVAALAIPPPLE